MNPVAFIMESNEFNSLVPRPNPPSRLIQFDIAIAIIAGIAGLIVGGAGLAGCLHIGVFSNLSQVQAICMMAAGGAGLIYLFLFDFCVNNFHKICPEYTRRPD